MAKLALIVALMLFQLCKADEPKVENEKVEKELQEEIQKEECQDENQDCSNYASLCTQQPYEELLKTRCRKTCQHC
ncbi:unnamed protein product [Dracunculus medinensis]|uniref:ShKT domain-containing protein n=1 Tax=Dracunculus medinensis TaxID=318479 RepID=A0A0N4UKN6_DRAME|nr:unnamed protein product [Dracunculus medinensis]